MTTNDNGAPGDHTPLTPPPAASTGAQPPQAPVATQAPAPAPTTGHSAGTTAVLVVTAVLGGLALLGTGGTAAAAAAGSILSSSSPDSVQTVSVDGIEGVELDADASSVRVEFGDVDEAELSVTNGRGTAWTFERDDDDLIVRSPRAQFGWWFGNWFGGEEVVVLTLPADLQGRLDADLTLNAGSLHVVGDFSALDLSVNAGSLDVEGSARTLDLQMNAGSADVLLDDVAEADLGVAAGDLSVELTGSAPRETDIDVSAGSLDLTVPDVEYRIVQNISAGSLDAKVDQAETARSIIDVTLSAGSVTIRPTR